MSKPTLSFNAIETKYHGYRFRSRLEARWATFFDALSLEYRYEPEGYALENVPYLPDFYLPQQNCFLEIKGQQPNQEEKEKARLLALYTGKDVYILFGDLWIPEESNSYNAYLFTSPTIYTYPEGSNLDDEAIRKVDTRQEVKVILQKLHDHNITVEVRHGLVTLYSMHMFSQHEYSSANFLASLKKQYDDISQLSPLLQEYSVDLIHALTPDIGWKREFYCQMLRMDYVWVECCSCKEIALLPKVENSVEEELIHQQCHQKKQGTYVCASPRLRTAYNAARQARF